MANLKIVLVGGGSFSWTPRLVSNVLNNAFFNGSEVMLYDLDANALGADPRRMPEVPGGSRERCSNYTDNRPRRGVFRCGCRGGDDFNGRIEGHEKRS